MEHLFNRKSIFAKLLAGENITVINGRFATASFDMNRRILRIPVWENMTNDEYDMLVGHEVGHALYSGDIEDIKVFLKEENIPFGYWNIVEDVRIERMVLERFPGLIGKFISAYDTLLDRDFFGVGTDRAEAEKKITKLDFIDRLNIHAKARTLLKVSFSKKEQVFVDRAKTAKDQDEVFALLVDIKKFLSNKIQIKSKTFEIPKELELNLDSDGYFPFPTKGESDAGKTSAPEKTSETSDTSESEEKPGDMLRQDKDVTYDPDALRNGPDLPEKEDYADDENSVSGGIGNGPAKDSVSKETDDEFDDEFGDEFELEEPITVSIEDDFFQKTSEEGPRVFNVMDDKGFDAFAVYYDEAQKYRKPLQDSDREDYKGWKVRNKAAINALVDEFERKRMAWRTSRELENQTGSLDVTRLHEYKFNDDIFKTNTHLMNGQSHGIVMIIDFSGSMSTIIHKVLDQVLVMINFAKRVNIPYEVWGFTSQTFYMTDTDLESRKTNHLDVNYNNLKFVQYASSTHSMKKAIEAETVIHSIKHYRRGIDGMGGTPLVEATLCAANLVKRMKQTYNLDKVNYIALTDGGGYYIGYNGRVPTQRDIILLDGKRLVSQKTLSESSVIEYMKKEFGCVCMNYHFISKNELLSSVRVRANADAPTGEEAKLARLKGLYVVESDPKKGKTYVFDKYIFVLENSNRRGRRANPAEPKFKTVTQSAKALEAMGQKKKLNRLIAQKISDAIA